jgi:hypothetical protein
MSTLVPDAKFLRGIFVGLCFAAAASAAGLIYALNRSTFSAVDVSRYHLRVLVRSRGLARIAAPRSSHASPRLHAANSLITPLVVQNRTNVLSTRSRIARRLHYKPELATRKPISLRRPLPPLGIKLVNSRHAK